VTAVRGFGIAKAAAHWQLRKLAKMKKSTKLWVTIGIGTALFFVGAALLFFDPFSRSQIEKFQTLLTGMFAIFAATIAFLGAVRAANIQAQAGHAQAQATFSAMSQQLDHQHNREREERQHAETDFTMAIMLCGDYFRKDLKAKKAIMREIIKVEQALSVTAINSFHVQLHSILLSGWKELSLLNPRTMEQVIRVQSVANAINMVVDRLREDTLNAGVVSSEILDDLEEHYNMAITYISEFVPAHITPPPFEERSPQRVNAVVRR
jgi:hypothetical protein